MKKLLVLFSVLVSSSVFASSDPWVFEPTIGPSIGINDMGHNFLLEPRIGKENIKAGLGMYLGNNVAFRPHVAVDLPYYLTLQKSNDFIIGPTFDAGPSFNVKDGKSIDFLMLGAGLKLGYKINNEFGVIFVPIHLGMSFVRWASGAGTSGIAGFTYDMKFGVYLNL